MTSEPSFDRSIKSLLRDVLDRESGPHHAWADSPAARRIVELGRRERSGRWPIRTFAIAAILVLGSAALAALGVGRAVRVDGEFIAVNPSVTPTVADPLRIPGELHGTWTAAGYRLDFRSAPWLSRSSGEPLPEFGGVVQVDRQAAPSEDFSVRIGGTCGNGVYEIVREDVTRIRFVLSADPCPNRAAILTRTSWNLGGARLGPKLGPFVVGQTYDSGTFTEPFTFVMPAVDAIAAPTDTSYTASPYVSAGGLRFGDVYWSMSVLDDQPINSDLCDEASAALPDIPSTPAAVGDWLRSERDWRVSDGVGVTVDGRTALRFRIDEIEGEPTCHRGRLPLGGYYGYAHVAYAIPTGDDTILVIGGGDDSEGARAVVDAFVRSMNFQ